MTTSSDQLPSDLADAHAMIVALRSEALICRLETEKLKFLIAKLRREQFGQSSERGRLLVEHLELAIADVEEMPFIANPNLATASSTMSFVEGNCTTAAGRIRASTGRHRTKPISSTPPTKAALRDDGPSADLTGLRLA